MKHLLIVFLLISYQLDWDAPEIDVYYYGEEEIRAPLPDFDSPLIRVYYSDYVENSHKPTPFIFDPNIAIEFFR